MTDKTKAVFILILLSAFLLALTLAGCSPFPGAPLQLDRCEYQLIPALPEVQVPVLEEYHEQKKAKEGMVLCQR